jgi:hypothetical protein
MSIHSGSRQILCHGLFLVLFGLVWGFAVPATPHPRLALGAHIQFMTNGMLFLILAIALLSLPHRVGIKSVAVMVVSAYRRRAGRGPRRPTMAGTHRHAHSPGRGGGSDHRMVVAHHRRPPSLPGTDGKSALNPTGGHETVPPAVIPVCPWHVQIPPRSKFWRTKSLVRSAIGA